MLSPDNPATPPLLVLTLAALLAFMVLRAVRKDQREYRRFKRYRSTLKRQRMFRKWLRQSFLGFGGAAAVVLVIAWQFVPLLQEAVDRWGFVASARRAFDDSGWLGPALVVALVVALVGGVVVPIYLLRKETEVPAIGDVQALLPRNRDELKYSAALSVNAGVVEELLFRLALPTLIFGASGSAVLAVVFSVFVFGVLHAYQGVAGVIGSTIIGAVFMALYLATGNILVVIVVHALFDLRSLVLIPMVVFGVHRIDPGTKLEQPTA